MGDLWDQVNWLLIFIRNQCMPVAIGDQPGAVDYAIVTLATVGMAGGVIWFAWGLAGRDPARHDAVKAQVLED